MFARLLREGTEPSFSSRLFRLDLLPSPSRMLITLNKRVGNVIPFDRSILCHKRHVRDLDFHDTALGVEQVSAGNWLGPLFRSKSVFLHFAYRRLP